MLSGHNSNCKAAHKRRAMHTPVDRTHLLSFVAKYKPTAMAPAAAVPNPKPAASFKAAELVKILPS